MALPNWLSAIYDADEMRASDAWAINEVGVPSLELMEAAGAALATRVAEIASPGPIRVVCGKGNNAGDGFVAARHLRDSGHEVDVLLLWPADELKGDSAANFAHVRGLAREIDGAEIKDALAGSGAVVDAIFGTGFSGAPRAPADAAIEAINECGSRVVATDIASGIDASTGEIEGACVDAEATVTFHGAKLGQWVAPGKWRSGDVRVVEIGIPSGAPIDPHAGLIRPEILERLPGRGAESNKFTSGQVLVVGGSRGLTGAVCMASEAAIRSGAGYATVALPAELEPIVEVKLTEVMSIGCEGADGALVPAAEKRILDAAEPASAVVVGPGLGRSTPAFALARAVVGKVAAPLLLDADGLNAHAGALESLRSRSAPTVLTPHAGELGRLLGRSAQQISAARVRSAGEAARASGSVVVLKGDDTIVTDGESVAVNAVASPGLATAGSGDVLSGTIAALMARGVEAFEAACTGVIAHARAGRRAAASVGVASVIATDVIASLPSGLDPEAGVGGRG